MPNDLKIALVQQVLHVLSAPSEEVVHTNHLRQEAAALGFTKKSDAGLQFLKMLASRSMS